MSFPVKNLIINLFIKCEKDITKKLASSNLLILGIKKNTFNIGLDIFIIDCVIGLCVLVLKKAINNLRVKTNTIKAKNISINCNPNCGNEFDIKFNS
tara:strand:+ start:942 stop:1232 length:291 start_codon:yes stop_codon:yes gene_type:complete